MIVMAWQWNGMAVILYLAGLQNVPDDLKHAAMIDGAGRFRAFRDITFPMLAPAFTIVTVLSFILIFRAFDLIYILGGPAGVPDGATLVLGVLIYSDAFGQGAFNSSGPVQLRHGGRGYPLHLPGGYLRDAHLVPGTARIGGEVMTSRELSRCSGLHHPAPNWRLELLAQSFANRFPSSPGMP